MLKVLKVYSRLPQLAYARYAGSLCSQPQLAPISRVIIEEQLRSLIGPSE